MAGVSDLNNRKILFIGGVLFVALVVLIILVNVWVRSSLQDIQSQATSPPVTAQKVEVETMVVPALHHPPVNAPEEAAAPEPADERVPSKDEGVAVEKEAPITTKILNE